MPKFEWRGTMDGRKTSGTIVAETKRDALDRIRAVAGVTVESLKQRGDDDDSVPDAPSPAASPTPPTTTRGAVRPAVGPRPLRGLLIALGFVAAAAGVNYLAPIVTYRCERAGDGAATCSVTSRLLGYPIERQVLAGVERAATESRSYEDRAGGRPVERAATRLVFHNAGASIRPADWDYPTTARRTRRSRTPAQLADDFNAFLADPSQTALSRWHVQTVPIIVVGVLLLLSVATLGLTWIVLRWQQSARPR